MGGTPPPEDEDLARQDREFLAAMAGEVAPAATAVPVVEAAAADQAAREGEEFLRHLAGHPPAAPAPPAPRGRAPERPLAARDLRRLGRDPTWSPDGQIDLHGRTRGVAVDALERFVHWAAGEGLSHLLVVVGQGHHSPAGEGVVAAAVRRWLDGRGLAYTVAPPRLGGGGALLVALPQPPRRC